MSNNKPNSTINFVHVLPKKERFAFLTWKFLFYFLLLDALVLLIVFYSLYQLKGGLEVKKEFGFIAGSAPRGYGLKDKEGFYQQLKVLSQESLAPNWLYAINLSAANKLIGLYGYGEEQEQLEQALFKTQQLADFWFKHGNVKFLSYVTTDKFNSFNKILSEKKQLLKQRRGLQGKKNRLGQSIRRQKKTAKNNQLKKSKILQRQINNLDREIYFIRLIEIKFNAALEKEGKKKPDQAQKQALWLRVKSALPCCHFSLEQNG